jgi:hypothetical protein
VENPLTAKEFAEIAGALAWPITAIGVIALFYKPIRALLDRLAATLTVKTVKLKAFGAEVELTPEEAKGALDELLQDIADSTNELSLEETLLFQRIMAAAGRDTVIQLLPNFRRDTIEHQMLRKLRDRKLVRPIEGGNWQPEKRPIATRFGQLVYDLRRPQSSQNPS